MFTLKIIHDNGTLEFRSFKESIRQVVFSKYNQLCSEGTVSDFQEVL